MRLTCEVEISNRLLPTLNLKSLKRRAVKSTLALGKEIKDEASYFILHFSALNKQGTKYKVTDNIEQVFAKFWNEGKATVRLKAPPNDLILKADPIQLKFFLKALKLCIDRNVEALKLINLSNISVTMKDNAPTKLIILERENYPLKGLPRTLHHLQISGLKMCNFKREILTLRNLKILDLSNNCIQKLPPEIGNMPHLVELQLNKNELGTCGVEGWKWMEGKQITQKLRLLDLSFNGIGETLPSLISKLSCLVTLKLDNNNINYLPKGIGRLRALKYLTASKNNLSSLPSSIFSLRLESIDLSSNPFNREDAPHQFDISYNFSTGRLVELAGLVVLKYKLYYSNNTIPYTLVDYLNESNYCICGKPHFGNDRFERIKLSLREFCTMVSLDSSVDYVVNFDCHFCSHKCLKNFSNTRRQEHAMH